MVSQPAPTVSMSASPRQTSGAPLPRSFPRKRVAARDQKSAWLSPEGSLSDVCGGLACRLDNFSA